MALASFFENEHEDVPIPDVSEVAEQPRTEAIANIGNDLMSEIHDEIRSVGTIGSSKPKKSSTKPKVTTLFNMNTSSSDDDEEEGQAFYAGGSERSGQQVLGPPRRKPEGHDVVSEVFRLAQENGAEVVERSTPSGSSASGSMFGGAGYRLGMTPDDHEALPNATRVPRPHKIEPVVLKLWRQGFSINNGELRLYEDPVNKEFLNSIKRGEIPNELRQLAGTGTVDFELEDHRHEEFKKPAASKIQTFSGQGHTLGSPAPNVVTTEMPPSNPETNEQNQKKATESITIDESQPTAMIQVRLADGSRISGRFNHSHTVSDIRQYVRTARPVYENVNFTLLTTFPSKELDDDKATIASAGLQGSTIMQRLK